MGNLFTEDKFSLVFVASMLAITLTSCQITKPGVFEDASGTKIHREFIVHRDSPKKNIEFFWAKPKGEGPWPVLIYIHGHQIDARNGGMQYVKRGRVRGASNRDYVGVALSQPGYGNSDGPPDYGGPFSQNAVIETIRWLRKQNFVKPDKIALYGVSRGAIVASMVATKVPDLAAVVLVAGIYDFNKGYPTGRSGLDNNIEIESGTSNAAFADRSAMMHTEKIKSPVLLLHGENDDRFSAHYVREFGEKLKITNSEVEIEIIPDAGHDILRFVGGDSLFLEKHMDR